MAQVSAKFFNKAVTITPQTVSKEAGGAAIPGTAGTAISIQGAFQPIDSSDNIIYQRDTNSLLATLYLPPTDNNGAAWSFTQGDIITVAGADWHPHGSAMNMSGQGTLYKIIIERKA